MPYRLYTHIYMGQEIGDGRKEYIQSAWWTGYVSRKF